MILQLVHLIRRSRLDSSCFFLTASDSGPALCALLLISWVAFGLPRDQVDSELNTLLMRLPNLLDSRVPDGDGEEENVVVAEWGQEYIKNGEVSALQLCVLRRILWVSLCTSHITHTWVSSSL